MIFTPQSRHFPAVGLRFLNTALETDPHFFYDPPTDRWYAAIHTTLRQPVQRSTFVVIDIETTGFKPGSSSIIEVAAIRIQNSRPVEEFYALVNPGCYVPAKITRLTGITDEMLLEQPRIDTIFSKLYSFLGSTVIVGHNVNFDFSFLNCEAHRLISTPLLNPALCTQRLARRLLPDLHPCSLEALAAHLGVSQADRHRAQGDVRITLEVLFLLLEKLAAQARDQHLRSGA